MGMASSTCLWETATAMILRCCSMQAMGHFRSWISDCSRQGLRLQLSEDLRLESREALVLSCDRFGMVHAEVVWRQGETIGMRIRNWQTAAASSRIEPHFPSPLFS